MQAGAGHWLRPCLPAPAWPGSRQKESRTSLDLLRHLEPVTDKGQHLGTRGQRLPVPSEAEWRAPRPRRVAGPPQRAEGAPPACRFSGLGTCVTWSHDRGSSFPDVLLRQAKGTRPGSQGGQSGQALSGQRTELSGTGGMHHQLPILEAESANDVQGLHHTNHSSKLHPLWPTCEADCGFSSCLAHVRMQRLGPRRQTPPASSSGVRRGPASLPQPRRGPLGG